MWELSRIKCKVASRWPAACDFLAPSCAFQFKRTQWPAECTRHTAVVRVPRPLETDILMLYFHRLVLSLACHCQIMTKLQWSSRSVDGDIPRKRFTIFCQIGSSLISITRNQICAVLGYYAASSGNSLPTFRDNLSVLSSRVKKSFLGFLTLEEVVILYRRFRKEILVLENGTDRLSRNVGKGLLLDAA
jgi:hypothetical protein